MCELKTVLIVAALLLAVTGFCIYQVKSEKKVGKAKSKVKVLAKKSTKKIVWTEESAII